MRHEILEVFLNINMKVSQEFTGEEKFYADVFLEKYDSIKKWALQITNYNFELAEDLVHDVFLKLQNRAVAASTHNVDAYLYVSLKNHFQTKIRKEASEEFISLTDNDFLANSILTFDPRRQLKIHDQLYAICRYACYRKDSSIAGSVLIFKFFHGYYVSEISRLIRRKRNAVEARLVKVRFELARHLENPDAGIRLENNFCQPVAEDEKIQTRSDLIYELRREIFSTKKGKCYSIEECREIYFGNKKLVNRQFVSHIVSCEKCLKRINNLFGMPSLEERDPLDFLRQKASETVIKVFSAVASLLYFFSFNLAIPT